LKHPIVEPCTYVGHGDELENEGYMLGVASFFEKSF
jgi:hypothetical protein